MGILKFFEKKPKIFEIEERDIAINKEIFSLITRIEENLSLLKESIAKGNIGYKDVKLAELENNFLLLRSKIENIRNDIGDILNIEVTQKEFITINDDVHIQDKLNRLELISDALEELIQIMTERPAFEELKGLNDTIYSKINLIIEAINYIINDDRYLENAYARIQYL